MPTKQTAIIFKADLARLIKSHIAIYEAAGKAAEVAALRALLVAVEGG